MRKNKYLITGATVLALMSIGTPRVLAEEPVATVALEESKSAELKYVVDEVYEWNIHSGIDFGKNKGFDRYAVVKSNVVAVTKNVLAEGNKLVIKVKGSGTNNAFTINNGGNQTLSYKINNGEGSLEVNDTVLEVASGTNEVFKALSFTLHTRNFGELAGIVGPLPAEIAGSYNGTVTYTAEIEKPLESYVGCYADVDGNGTVDGVIFADLAFSKTGKWDDNFDTSNYSYDAIPTDQLKNYTISQENYSGAFGDKPVLSPEGSGKDRFYVMVLEDFGDNTYEWYDAAHNNMNDYASTTNEAFGSGKTNTATMINKWNAQAYGNQNYDNDIWGAIQAQANNGWFLPSARDWSAFGSNLGITYDNYQSFGIDHGDYWTSTQVDEEYIYVASPADGRVAYTISPSNSNYVRLTTTY